jgi:hypothetical protein
MEGMVTRSSCMKTLVSTAFIVLGSGGCHHTDIMTASLDGAPWNGVTIIARYNRETSSFAIDGWDAADPNPLARAIGFAVTAPEAETYELTPGQGLGSVSIGTHYWSTTLDAATGTVRFTVLTPRHAVGTFMFTATPADRSTTGTKMVSGTFDVHY